LTTPLRRVYTKGMDPVTLAVFAAVAVLLLVILVRVFSGGPATQQLLDLKKEIADLRTRQAEAQSQSLEALTGHLTRTQDTLATQLAGANRAIADVNQKLGSLGEATRRIQEIGRDVASLQDVLQAPKLRGNLGEYLLEDLLRQVLPAGNWAVKHRFRDGTQVDAVIRLAGSLVSIDAKFPLESFRRISSADAPADRQKARREFVRSVKLRIDEIADRYIKPDEGTFDFAMMYVPAENVFYEIITAEPGAESPWELFQYAWGRRVIPVSPNSFYSYLMAIAYGLRGMRIEQRARTIVGELRSVQEAFGAWTGDFAQLGRHLKNAGAKFDECQRKVDQFGDRVARIAGAEGPTDAADPQASRRLP
jgi:DNA recombination protein RmuC